MAKIPPFSYRQNAGKHILKKSIVAKPDRGIIGFFL
jgi:hypothetical protein